MNHAWLGLLLVAVTSGCGATITVDGDDGEGGEGGFIVSCGEPPPPSGGYCPPIWECVDGEWIDLGGACPEPTCPSDQPTYGSSCEVLGQLCEYYSDDDCGYGSTAECTEEGWIVYELLCSPPPECPEEAPIAGTSCAGWDYAYDCYYTTVSDCGDVTLWAYCDFEQGWSVVPDSFCEPCGYHDASGCEADPACRWAVPGCGDLPLPEAGCFPEAGCTETGCPLDESCTTVTIDPCWASECDACGAPFDVCLPSMDGG